MTMERVGPIVVSGAWGIACILLIVEGWVASANLVIAIAALVRGRASRSRTFEALVGALVTGVFCSLLLRLGFWWLVEVMGFGRTMPEKIAFFNGLGLGGFLMVRPLPARIRKAWRTAMDSDTTPGEAPKPAGT